MKCINCGSSMTTKRENVPFTALPGVTLVGVEVSRCASCGEYEVAIPAMDKLMDMLAKAVVSKPGRLNGDEIRFLRKHLGYSGVDFAKLMKSAPTTVSKWESGAQPIGQHADLLLRTFVILDKKIEDYGIKELADVADDGAPLQMKYAFKPSGTSWKPTQVQTAA